MQRILLIPSSIAQMKTLRMARHYSFPSRFLPSVKFSLIKTLLLSLNKFHRLRHVVYTASTLFSLYILKSKLVQICQNFQLFPCSLSRLPLLITAYNTLSHHWVLKETTITSCTGQRMPCSNACHQVIKPAVAHRTLPRPDRSLSVHLSLGPHNLPSSSDTAGFLLPSWYFLSSKQWGCLRVAFQQLLQNAAKATAVCFLFLGRHDILKHWWTEVYHKQKQPSVLCARQKQNYIWF